MGAIGTYYHIWQDFPVSMERPARRLHKAMSLPHLPSASFKRETDDDHAALPYITGLPS